MIHYIITTDGAEPIENNPKNIDYQHYSERQLALLQIVFCTLRGVNFEQITQRQMDVFGEIFKSN